jgi:hypothetical protein
VKPAGDGTLVLWNPEKDLVVRADARTPEERERLLGLGWQLGRQPSGRSYTEWQHHQGANIDAL